MPRYPRWQEALCNRLVSVKERQFASLFGYSVADGEPLPGELLDFGVQFADGWRRSGAGGDQLAQQLLDADVDVVADAAHHLDRLAGRVLELPVLVPLAGVDRAGVAAAHGDHRIGGLDELVGQRLWE